MKKKDIEWLAMLADDEELQVAWEKYLQTVPEVQAVREDVRLARASFLEASEDYEFFKDNESLKEFVHATNILKSAITRLKVVEAAAGRATVMSQ